MFYDRYSCFPGDCTSVQIPDLMSAGLTTNCTAAGVTATYSSRYGLAASAVVGPTTLVLGNSNIDSAVKRSCMFYELQLANLTTGVTPSYNTAANLADSVAGKNIPIAKFSSQSAWDFTTVWYQSNNGAIGQVTYETATVDGVSGSWNGAYGLVLRDANVIASNQLYGLYCIWSSSGYAALSSPGISSKLASKLDAKFDDGMPLQGNIRSARNSTLNCTSGAISTISTSHTYLSTSSLSTGCFLTYYIPTITS